MSDKLKEDMSALVDGELAARSVSETIDVLLASNELRASWFRYHVLRDVLRHKVYPDADGKLCERVRSCLSDEPLHFPRRGLLPRRWRETLRPVAGVALAASVAVVAILAVRGPQQAPDQPQTTPSPSTQVAATVTPAILPASESRDGRGRAKQDARADITTQGRGRPAALKRLQWSSTELAVVDRLTGYLVDYNEHVGGPITGLHPYARVVGYDSSGQR